MSASNYVIHTFRYLVAPWRRDLWGHWFPLRPRLGLLVLAIHLMACQEPAGLTNVTKPSSEACQGWMEDVAQDTSLLTPYSSDAWRALLDRNAIRAASLFTQVEGTSHDQIGLARAWVEVADLWTEARRLTLESTRNYLDARISRPVTGLSDDEFLWVLRAAVALQMGEGTDLSPWLTHVSSSGPWAQARSFLTGMAAEPADGRLFEAASSVRFYRHYDGWIGALGSAHSPTVVSSGRGGTILGLTRPEVQVDLSAWISRVGESRFDFVISRNGAPFIEMYDPSTLTALSVRASMEAQSILDRIPPPERGAAWWHLSAKVAELLGQKTRLTEICEGNQAQAGSKEDLGWYVFSGLRTSDDALMSLKRICRQVDSACPSDIREVQESFGVWSNWVDVCNTSLMEKNRPAAEVSMSLNLFDAPAGWSSTVPLRYGNCSRTVEVEAFRAWEGTLVPRSRAWDTALYLRGIHSLVLARDPTASQYFTRLIGLPFLGLTSDWLRKSELVLLEQSGGGDVGGGQ